MVNQVSNNNSDNSQLSNSQIDNDFKAIMKVSYRQLRRLIDIDALLSTAQILLAELAAQPSQLTLRQAIIMRKAITSRIIDINRHKLKIERINAGKVNTQRRQREDAARYRAEGSILPTLLTHVIDRRSEQARIDKEQAQINRATLLPAIQRQFKEAGYNPLATSTERAEWARLRDTNRHAIPGTDLSTQGDEIMRRMTSIEAERTAAQPSGSNELIKDDISTIGTADEWIDKL